MADVNLRITYFEAGTPSSVGSLRADFSCLFFDTACSLNDVLPFVLLLLLEKLSVCDLFGFRVNILLGRSGIWWRVVNRESIQYPWKTYRSGWFSRDCWWICRILRHEITKEKRFLKVGGRIYILDAGWTRQTSGRRAWWDHFTRKLVTMPTKPFWALRADFSFQIPGESSELQGRKRRGFKEARDGHGAWCGVVRRARHGSRYVADD